jgi:hypothetical protein
MNGTTKKVKRTINLITWGRKGRRRSNRNTARNVCSLTLLVAIVSWSPVSALVTEWLGISEPSLVHVGGVPVTPLLELKEQTPDRHILHITMRPIFRNWSFKAGHIAKVTIALDGLNDAPQTIDVMSLDRSEIGAFRQREIRCELFATVDAQFIGPEPSTLRFRVYFYGPKGNQIYWEGIEIEGWKQTA